MGNTCGCGTDLPTQLISNLNSSNVKAHLNLEAIDIQDFETRIKKFAHPVNKGHVTVDQLCEAFKDTGIFNQLRNPYSILYKLLMSPFFKQLPLTHYQKQNDLVENDVFVWSETEEKRRQGPFIQQQKPQRVETMQNPFTHALPLKMSMTSLANFGTTKPHAESFRSNQQSFAQQNRATADQNFFSFQHGLQESTKELQYTEMRQSVVTFATGNEHVFAQTNKRWADMISIDALILLACVQCSGSDRAKAEVFSRVFAPEMGEHINQSDRDLKLAFHFMVSTATIFEEMVRDIAKQPMMGLNAQLYQDRIKKYAPTYDGMTDDFYDNIFVEFASQSTRQEFISNLAANGWKYFDLANLNELFVLNLERFGTQEAVHLPEFMQDGGSGGEEFIYGNNFGQEINSEEYGIEGANEVYLPRQDAGDLLFNSDGKTQSRCDDELEQVRAYMTPTLNAIEADEKDSEKNQPMHLIQTKQQQEISKQ